MRLPQVRFTVRRAMIVVALAAFMLAGFRAWQWRAHYLERASSYGATANDCADAAAWLELLRDDTEEKARRGDLSWKDSAVNLRREAEKTRRWSAYWDQLRRKYKAAAARPWLPIEPDPPLRLPALPVPKSIDVPTAPAS